MANNSTTSSHTADALSTSEVITKSDYMKYLTSYESMVRQQDIEFTATSEHMQLLFKRIQTVGSKKKNSDGDRFDKNSSSVSSPPSGMLTYLQIRRSLLRMGIGWNKNSGNNNNGDYDDDVSVLSFNSTASFTSGLSSGTRSDIIATDAQLIMLLTTLVEMEEVYRSTGKKDGYSPPRRGKKKKQYQLDQGLFLPEFIQCYEIIIGGMNSLKSATTADSTSEESTCLCTRLKERTMGMLRPFGPDSQLYNDTLREKNSTLSLSPVKGSWRSSVKISSTPSKKRLGFSNKEMKKVMRSKDVTLAKIIEEQEEEMNMLAVSLEELMLKEQRARNALKKRRRRAIICAILLAGFIVGIGVRIEKYQRESLLESEMTAEQKEDRMKDLATIAQLKEKKQKLETDLGVLDGKRRYQVNRNNDVESQTSDTQKKIDELDVKWLLDKAETERCFVSHSKMKQELEVEKLKTTVVDEEAAWCQSQLQSREKELNELKHVGGRSIVTSSDGDTKKGLMSFPKSIRKNIILRQVYSAAGGVAVSVLLQVVAPSALKLFLPRALVPPVVVPDYRRVEMAIVDGIFGSQIAFLLYRGIAVFLAPL